MQIAVRNLFDFRTDSTCVFQHIFGNCAYSISRFFSSSVSLRPPVDIQPISPVE